VSLGQAVEARTPLTHARVLRIAIPIVLANATVPILGAVDTGVIGQLGEAAPIGAVGIGAVILATFYWVFGFLRMGTTGLTANAAGAGDTPEVAALLTRALMIGLGAGLVIIVAQVPLFWIAFRASPASAEVEALARSYMGIRIFSAPAAIALYGLTGWLIAQERTGAVLAVQLAMNGVNIGLDLLFVLQLEWGVEGVALATLISEWAGLGLGFWLCRGAFAVPAWRDWARVFDRTRLTRMALVNRDILLRSLMLQGIVVSFMFLGSNFGDVQLAANQVLMQFLLFTAFALDGFAFAAEALVGQSMGRGERDSLRRSVVLSGGWGLVICVVMSLAFWIFGGMIIDLMTSAPDVRIGARRFLPWIIAAPVFGVWAWMLDGVFIGATRAGDMRNMMAISLVVYVASVAVLVPAFGNHGLWASYLISFVARGVTLGLRYPALEAQVRAG
tara:strand:- start:89422 stop:90759 length:1338 start_codon:yes stop_codon:yes gene_type:complete